MKTNTRHQMLEPLESRIAPAFALNVSLGSLLGFNGSQLNGENSGDFAGVSVADAGDVNGDGYDDIIIGAPFSDSPMQGSGTAYVVFGKASGLSSNLSLADLDGGDGFILTGLNEQDANSGGSVSGVGDVNGDGFDDIAVGSPNANAGVVSVIFGKSVFAKEVSLASAVAGQSSLIFGALLGDGTGDSVSGAGDINNDGFDDIIIGAPNATSGGVKTGAAYVIYGAPQLQSQIFLGVLSSSIGFKITGESAGSFTGSAVDGAGDVNGDGFDDMIVGAEGFGTGGASYVVYGKKASFGGNFDLASLNGNNGFRITGEGAGGASGRSVAGAGDMNGDGFDDIIISSPLANTADGTVHVVFGKGSGFNASFSLSALNGTNGFQINPLSSDAQFGVSVSGAGDVNGDGLGDILIGAPYVVKNGVNVGQSYVIFGKTGAHQANLGVDSLNGSNGFLLTGEVNSPLSGFAVGGGGDVNGDGYSDILIGAPSGAGSAYLVNGDASGMSIDPMIKGNVATFMDVDGDVVTVKVSKGEFFTSSFNLVQPAGSLGAKFLELKLTGDHSGADVTVSVKKSATGDGRVNLGYLNATGTDLGNVKIAGGLEHVSAGDTNDSTAGLKSLSVAGSFGRAGLPAQARGESLASTVIGPLGSFSVGGDFIDASLKVAGSNVPSQGKIGKLKIGGSVLASERGGTGLITATGDIGSVTVGRDLVASDGLSTGVIGSFGRIGQVKIGGDIRGGEIGASGGIFSQGNMGSVKIGGSLIGGESASSGYVNSGGIISKLSVGGDIAGGHIYAFKSLGNVAVKGDVVGTVDAHASIAAGGSLNAADSPLAIAKLTVGGRVEYAEILAGVNSTLQATNGHTQIGKVMVNGDWIASNLAAGVDSNNGGFGNADDTLAAGGPAGVVAKIASITIKGSVRGTKDSGDHFGFVADEIGALKIGPIKYALSPANDLLQLGSTADVTVREV